MNIILGSFIAVSRQTERSIIVVLSSLCVAALVTTAAPWKDTRELEGSDILLQLSPLGAIVADWFFIASHTNTMLPTRKSVYRTSRQSDHMKTSGPS